MIQSTISVIATHRGLHEITDQLLATIPSWPSHGLCNVFVHHTSASLIIQENADPDVCADLETFFQKIVPDGSPEFTHIDEGPDDMPAHICSVLTATSLNIPVAQGRLQLGQWQGIYLWEHRFKPRR